MMQTIDRRLGRLEALARSACPHGLRVIQRMGLPDDGDSGATCARCDLPRRSLVLECGEDAP